MESGVKQGLMGDISSIAHKPSGGSLSRRLAVILAYYEALERKMQIERKAAGLPP
jgi:hypothetical protein